MLSAIAISSVAWPAAASVSLHCPGLPPAVSQELDASLSGVLANAGVASTLGVECDASGVWIVWFDGSRAMVDQTAGLVPGAVALVQNRLAYESYTAQYGRPPSPPSAPYDGPPRPELEVPPTEAARVEPEKVERKRTSEGGIGIGFATAFFDASSVGVGPRLDVGIGPPGPFALLLSEAALFGAGSSTSSQITMFEFQAGVGYGAPFKQETGVGAVLLVGAERIAAANARSDIGGLWEWTGTIDFGGRASLKLKSFNAWIGADLLFRTNDFDVGGPTPISIPTNMFFLSVGGFVPAFSAPSGSVTARLADASGG
jgi:hypothetical protein